MVTANLGVVSVMYIAPFWCGIIHDTMDSEFMFYVSIVAAVLIGWKLGVLERKVEDIISELHGLRKRKERR